MFSIHATDGKNHRVEFGIQRRVQSLEAEPITSSKVWYAVDSLEVNRGVLGGYQGSAAVYLGSHSRNGGSPRKIVLDVNTPDRLVIKIYTAAASMLVANEEGILVPDDVLLNTASGQSFERQLTVPTLMTRGLVTVLFSAAEMPGISSRH